MICHPDLMEDLNDILMEGLTPAPDGFGGIDCDAIDADSTTVLFGYTCDMPRIKRFDGGLTMLGSNGVLYCFDFQEEAMRQVCELQNR